MNRRILSVSIIVFLLFFKGSYSAQVILKSDTTIIEKKNSLTIGGGIDVYYSYDFNSPKNHTIPYYVSMNRHNEFNVNLAYIDLKFESNRVRSRFIPAIGTFMNANYADEPGLLKIPVEANVGVKLCKSKDIWLEAGVLSSPYTNENTFSKDHIMYTRSLASEYVPYYLSGAKLSYTLNSKLKFAVYLLNGWQQIVDKNDSKSLGTQVEFKPNKKQLINWNTYIGDERSASNPLYRTRYFTDIYWMYNMDGKFSFVSCLYIGNQQARTFENKLENNLWWQLNFSSRYTFKNNLALSARLEYFDDPNSIQIQTITSAKDFNCLGSAIGLTIPFEKNAFLRLEAKELFSLNNPLFLAGENHVPNTTILTANLTIWF
jgi:hypothetical protein